MKSLRFLGSILFGLVMLATAIAPADVQALVPIGVHDFVFGDGGVTIAAGATFATLNRKARGLANLGGIKQIILFAEGDFTADWPKASDVTPTGLAIAPPLTAGTFGTVLTMDLNTGRLKSSRKGDIGYQNVDVDGECKLAGYDASQAAGLDKTLNQGGVAICIYKDGTRVVAGASYEPLTFEDSTDSGAKADDKLQIDLKFKGMGYAFHPPVLASTVVIPIAAV
jgi:hypothetical protein